MIFYFCYLGLLAIFAGRYRISNAIKRSDKKLGYKLALFTIIFVSSLRFNIGYDWSSYLSMVYPKCDYRYLHKVEPLSALYIYLAAVLQFPLVLFTLFAVTTYGLIGKAIQKYSVSRYESLIIYIAIFYLESLSILRQAAAIAVVLYSYRFIKERKPVKYFFCCIIAFLYHRTAIISVMFYFIYYIKPVWTFLAAVFFIVGVKVVLPKVLGALFPVFLFYLNKNGIANSSGNLLKFVYLAIYIYCLILKSRYDRDAGRMLNICTLGVGLPFVLGGHTGARIAMYFLIYYVLLIPRVNKRFSVEYKAIFLLPFYAYFFLYLYITVVANQSTEYVPFRWYFLESLNQKLM